MSPAGIPSVQTGVGGNSTAGGGGKTENEWEKALDLMETQDPNRARLDAGDELVLLAPLAWRRISARRVINSTSMDFLGI